MVSGADAPPEGVGRRQVLDVLAHILVYAKRGPSLVNARLGRDVLGDLYEEVVKYDLVTDEIGSPVSPPQLPSQVEEEELIGRSEGSTLPTPPPKRRRTSSTDTDGEPPLGQGANRDIFATSPTFSRLSSPP